jgi:CubicO group peptidase (beta-lactamase class C family)
MPDRLHAVLAAGLRERNAARAVPPGMHAQDNTGPTGAPKTTTTVNGLVISTDWEHWTPLTNHEMANVLELELQNNANYRSDAAQPYKGVPFTSQHSRVYKFFIHSVHGMQYSKGYGTDWYVVAATHPGTLYTYEYGKKPYFMHDGRKYEILKSELPSVD